MAEPFSLFSSLRYDPQLKEVPAIGFGHAGWNYRNKSPFYMLDFHRDRILRAATHWKWEAAIDAISGDQGLSTIAQQAMDFIGKNKEAPLRLRILVNRDGDISFEKNDTPDLPLKSLFPARLPAPPSVPSLNEPAWSPQYTVFVDDTNIARSEYTHFKTTRRAMYDAARQRAGISPADKKEVLMVNRDDGSVMEGTMTTPYFWREDRWVTPPVSRNFSWEQGSGGQDGTTRRWALERELAVEQAIPASSLVDGEQCWISNGVRGFIPCVVGLKEPVS